MIASPILRQISSSVNGKTAIIRTLASKIAAEPTPTTTQGESK